ncbi:hypothetical protein G6F68_015184 [Rhizopus microsporus]|nr:hypothetical protein G6F68_015184 [Rhizopus microsporus]
MVSVRSTSVDNLHSTNMTHPASSVPIRSATMPVTNTYSNSEPDLLMFNDLSLEPQSTITHMPTNVTLAVGYELGYNMLLKHREGVLYENAQVQISANSEYHGSHGRMALYLTNKSSNPMTGINMMVSSTEQVKVELAASETDMLSPGAQIQRLVTVVCEDLNTSSQITYYHYQVPRANYNNG